MLFNVRRFEIGDEKEICNVIKKDILSENIKDYKKEDIEHLIKRQTEELILKRSNSFHAYTFLDKNKIVGVGMIGPYWGSLTESSFFTIFRDPDYKGKGLGRKIIETLERDEYYLRADRVEIPASVTAVEFYKHFGWGFKKLGNIVDNEGIYRMEKFPKISDDNSNKIQYNMRPYIDNEYHNYKEFVYQFGKDLNIKYEDNNWKDLKEEVQKKLFDEFIEQVRNDAWIIQLNGVDIGFYNGIMLEDSSYEINNICILPEYRGRGIGTQVFRDIMELHNNQTIYVRNFKSSYIGDFYERIGFVLSSESEHCYQLIREK